jgi:hemolysin III
VVGGWQGWLVFGVQWAFVIAGVVYKLIAIGKYPRLSLGLYLFMGWSGLFIADSVCQRMSILAIAGILAEGLFYTAGTYFFAHDERPNYHAIWHIFVLLGAVAHFSSVLCIVMGW